MANTNIHGWHLPEFRITPSHASHEIIISTLSKQSLAFGLNLLERNVAALSRLFPLQQIKPRKCRISATTIFARDCLEDSTRDDE